MLEFAPQPPKNPEKLCILPYNTPVIRFFWQVIWLGATLWGEMTLRNGFEKLQIYLDKQSCQPTGYKAG